MHVVYAKPSTPDVPIALTIGLLRSQLGRAAVSGLAVELRRTDGRPPLVDSLRRALGDAKFPPLPKSLIEQSGSDLANIEYQIDLNEPR